MTEFSFLGEPSIKHCATDKHRAGNEEKKKKITFSTIYIVNRCLKNRYMHNSFNENTAKPNLFKISGLCKVLVKWLVKIALYKSITA